ncbi:metallophosphoesterase [Lacipirellula parvula]|uniref:Calcineurin-like phosphoesterase domain-containing protein n=1 Tax=Lacipirellula parvula TaxID=2650471 RepID=A0A5K7X5F8_9BACT|nr:metallophosphoesterase [Lacipirellula parvula]BBO31944.1 hypothetical protein PLANPX_1556 [Lacipirellula parvula]
MKIASLMAVASEIRFRRISLNSKFCFFQLALGVLSICVLRHSYAATVLAVIGDEGSAGAGATRVANMVGSSSWATDYVLALGDNSGSNYAFGSPEWDSVIGARYGQFIKKRSGPAAGAYPNQTSEVQRFFPVVGDHDRDVVTGSTAGYVDYFHSDPGVEVGRLPAGVHDSSQSYYDFKLPIKGGVGSVHVFAMDSEAFAYSAESQAAQIEWLRDGLTSSDATWKFVTLHSPPFSSSLHNSNPLYQLPFQQWGANAVMSGHDHVYERVLATNAGENSMPYFVNGLGGSNIYTFTTNRAPGSEFRYNDDYGAMRITITDDEAAFEFLAVDLYGGSENTTGELIDSLTLHRSALPAPPTLQADFNNDGFVDSDDLMIWKASFGINDDGDATGDGTTDGADLLTWQRQRSNFQPDHPPTLSPVPEPATVALAAAGCALVIGTIPGRCRRPF